MQYIYLKYLSKPSLRIHVFIIKINIENKLKKSKNVIYPLAALFLVKKAQIEISHLEIKKKYPEVYDTPSPDIPSMTGAPNHNLLLTALLKY